MIFAGAVGNMLDRIFRAYVVDMLDFRGIWSFIFNFADVWINIGVVLIIVEHIFFNRKKEGEIKNDISRNNFFFTTILEF